MALPPPFPAAPPSDSLVHEPRLQKALDALGQKPRYSQAGFAVAELLGGTSRYAAWKPDAPRFSGSILKTAALFAGMQLRVQFRQAARGLKKDEILKAVTAGWGPLVTRSVSGAANFPQLDQIFNIKASDDIDFTNEFAVDLVNMGTYSNKAAAGRCIRRLGHQYINGALASAGLYSAKQSGMWLGGDYANIEYRPVAGGTTHYAATPAALLRFLDLLDAGRLVNEPASDQMKQVMKNFWTPDILKRQGKSFFAAPQSFGKLGWEDVEKVRTYFDAGVVSRRHDQGNFRYAIVVLGLPYDALSDLADALDNAVVNWHHKPPEPMARHVIR